MMSSNIDIMIKVIIQELESILKNRDNDDLRNELELFICDLKETMEEE